MVNSDVSVLRLASFVFLVPGTSITFEDYQVVDTCAADPDRMDIYTRGSCALAHVESFHFCV